MYGRTGTGIPTVPRLAYGKWKEQSLRELIYGAAGGEPRISLCNPEGVLEGIYLRVDGEDGFLKHRAKIVRHDFIQVPRLSCQCARVWRLVFRLTRTLGLSPYSSARLATSDILGAARELSIHVDSN